VEQLQHGSRFYPSVCYNSSSEFTPLYLIATWVYASDLPLFPLLPTVRRTEQPWAARAAGNGTRVASQGVARAVRFCGVTGLVAWRRSMQWGRGGPRDSGGGMRGGDGRARVFHVRRRENLEQIIFFNPWQWWVIFLTPPNLCWVER
jgi:hypothetical protein